MSMMRNVNSGSADRVMIRLELRITLRHRAIAAHTHASHSDEFIHDALEFSSTTSLPSLAFSALLHSMHLKSERSSGSFDSALLVRRTADQHATQSDRDIAHALPSAI